uniref:Exonuclease 1 n=1 Tax=Cajanus cajan TaxID=3821 RepID=A0A151R6G5_CAJCA|nr:Exonuclease 1 [Cajanus cajan]
MGIQGFLPLLKSIMVPIHIKDLKGSSVAVDTYSWLHKGALSCSTELCKGIPTTRHIEYCMHRVNLLRHFGVKPVLVFDGGLLPMKSDQENKRARARKDNFARAVVHESDGNSSAAYECYQKAVDISPQVARELIQVLKQENVQYVVAPYEADAQMTFLAISGQVDAVITEDSDLIPFGCPRIIFKMDKFGQGVQFQYSMLQKNKELSFEGFNRQMLLEMCILSGCDYLQSLPGMGLKRAHSSIKKFRSYDKVLKHLRYSGVSVPPFYEESFKKAILTFQYQRVYDPINENIVHLSNIPDDIGDDLTCYTPLPKDIAQRIAKGDLDPITKMPFEGDTHAARLAITGTSQFKIPHSENAKKKIDLPVQKNLLTKYFCFASLEAKRKFRAPRVSPTAANETKNSTASIIDSENWDNVPPPISHVNMFLTYSSISYFRLNMVLPQKILNLQGLHLMVRYESVVSMVGEEKKNPEHTVLRQPRQPIHKPCLGLHKEHEHTNFQDTFEGTTRQAIRKVIVRSAYFQHKQVEKNVCDEKQDRLSSGIVIDERENAIPDSHLCNNHLKNKDQRVQGTGEGKTREATRKVTGNLQPRPMHHVSPPHNNGCCDHNVDQPFTENNAEEEKFGTNISHLGQYSEIAEKSMEKFVSVISSFRCTSGTRVSGLRAPLKDVQNTSDNRYVFLRNWNFVSTS